MKAEQSNARNILPRLPQGAGSNLKSYSPTQLHFLMRLSHLQRQRRDMVNVRDGTDWHMRLVNKALYSTYRDCEDLGVGEEGLLPGNREFVLAQFFVGLQFGDGHGRPPRQIERALGRGTQGIAGGFRAAADWFAANLRQL